MMCSAFDHLAVLDNKDHVCVHDGGETMRDHKGRPALDDDGYRILDRLFRQCVNGSSRFIQDKDPGISDDRPGKGQQLFFTCRQHIPAFPDVAVEAFVHFIKNKVSGYELECRKDLFIRRFRLAVFQVVPDCAGEQYLRYGR